MNFKFTVSLTSEQIEKIKSFLGTQNTDIIAVWLADNYQEATEGFFTETVELDENITILPF